jgi:hypothetical protein
MTSHYIPAFTIRSGRWQRAACGGAVTQDQHSAQPTCEACREYLATAEPDLTVEEMFGTADPLEIDPVKPDTDPDRDWEARMNRRYGKR